MAENRESNGLSHKIKFEPQYLIFIFSFVILLAFIIVFVRPVYPAALNQTTDGTETPIVEATQSIIEGEITPTPTSLPPTPEEIGYTDGIIFWATLLVIILIVGTLRETLRRKGE